jgi:flavodoxin
MKKLVVFYSRTGTTKKVSEMLTRLLKADIDEIMDEKNRAGIFGYIWGGRDALSEKTTKIKFSKNPKEYDIIIIGTPIWAGKMAPAVRTYLLDNKSKLKKVAFFCTKGGEGNGKTFEGMEKLAGKPIATLSLRTKEVINNETEKAMEFIKTIKLSP